jgi:hypothetical protein
MMLRRLAAPALCGILLLLSQVPVAHAVNWGAFVDFTYGGGGVGEGIDEANAFNTGGTTDVRETITDILFAVFTFLGVIAVLVIVIAGILMIIGGADDGQREKAKNMILYAVIGLIVVTLAGAFVQWVATTFGD